MRHQLVVTKLNTLAWSLASHRERQHFLDGIGLKPILDDMPDDMRNALIAYVALCFMAEQPAEREPSQLPADLSIPNSLKRG